MTRAEAITHVVNLTNQDKIRTYITLTALLATIVQAIESGRTIAIPGFGTFSLKWRNETTGRLIQRNTTVIVPAHYIPHLKPFRQFKDNLRAATLPIPNSSNAD
jgi:DNA-binding protein HU-beta